MRRVWLYCLLLIGFTGQAIASDLVIYSSRGEQLIKPILDAYRKETGVTITLISDKEGALMERLRAAGKNSPADILLTADAGNLWQAEQMGLLKAVHSATLDANIPPHLRDPNHQWYGMSIRARTIFYNTDRVKPADLSTYAALAEAKWQGKLCLRTSKKVYNQSLVAMMLSEFGPEETERVVKGWVRNLAVPVFPDDTKMLAAIAAGQCEVGIANTYYYGRLMQKSPQLPLGLFWADQEGKGTHVNISGAGVTAHAKNSAGAIKFLEWLSSNKAQNLFADINLEFPANPTVKPAASVAAWGDFQQNVINVANAGLRQTEAVKLMDRAGYK